MAVTGSFTAGLCCDFMHGVESRQEESGRSECGQLCTPFSSKQAAADTRLSRMETVGRCPSFLPMSVTTSINGACLQVEASGLLWLHAVFYNELLATGSWRVWQQYFGPC